MLSPTPTIDRSNLHPGTGYLIAPRVPHGLATVVEGLTREVLRHRPEDIYVFAAHHFEKLLKLREKYHIEEYSNREFSHEFNRDFNLWPTKKTQNLEKPSNDDWSLEKEIKIFERREKTAIDTEESQEDISTDRENQKASKQTCSRGPATAKKTSKKSKDNETTSNDRATRIISQMTALHGPGKNIQTKDIKQELRKNKLSGEKSKATDSVEKGIRSDRRSRTRITKTDRGPAEEVECTTTTTTTKSSSKTSSRRPLKKVRRIETESETETEREIIAKAGFEDGHARSSIKNDNTIRETIIRTASRERKSEVPLSEHSSERKVSSRALSMDRIRAYVLRKFASTASLEVLRSPTYVEQVQEVIDRAAPIIKEKLEEIGRPWGKRSRSVDLAWNEKSLHQHVREEKRHGDEKESGRGKSGNGMERKADMKNEEIEDSLGKEEISIMEKKSRRRSIGSGKKSRRCESGDFRVVDEVDDNSKHSNKLEHESNATHDTLEARLTATQSILEDISKSTSELGARRNDPAGNEPSESEVSDHIISLPVVRPPSSRNSKSATKNGSDCLTLPPISPEAPKSTKKKNELSLPVLLTAINNGNYSARKSQEQDVSKDAEEASTMYDITSDIEDIAGFPENNEDAIDIKQEPNSNHQDLLISDVKFINEEGHEKNEDVDKIFDKKCESLEEFEELEKLEEDRKSEEVFIDSLNVTPEVADVPLRPDSLEPDEEVKLEDDYADPAQENAFDRLKDKLIEIEMAERSIEKALACQVATCDISEMTSQAEKSVTDGKINETGEPINEAEETVNEIRKSMDAAKIPINNKDDEERKKNIDDEKRKSINDIEKIKDVAEISNKTEDLNIKDKLTNKPEKIESEIKESTNKTENLINKLEANGIKKLMEENEAQNLKNTVGISKNEAEKVTDQTEIKVAENTTKAQDERSIDKTEKLNEKLSNGVEESVKIHVKNVQSINARSLDKDSQITEVVETDDNNTTSETKSENATNEKCDEFSQSTTSKNTTSESSITNLPNKNSQMKARKKRESDKLPMITPLSLELPYSYVLSEGSPCEIPDSVTTVIIPDKLYLSPVTLKDEDYQLESTNQKEKSLTHFNTEIFKDERQDKDQQGYDVEVFGEYIRPEATILSIDTDFVRSVKEIKSSQDIVIVHQDLNKIKEEGEEEVVKEDDERKKTESHQEKENDKEKNVKEEEMTKLATLENIMEHEETNIKTIESNDAEEISSGVLEYESLPDIKDLMIDTVLTNEGTAEFATESKSLLENSSEESGSTQNTHSTTSDIKESTTSNQSIESSSPDRPVVPELNLDSLQDNTVSSFKITTNEIEKEDRESDTTISLVEPLISDERLMNRLADHEEKIITEGLTERGLQSEIPEADQLYHAEHMEYKWLEKDPLSTEMNLEDETKSQENNIDLKTTLPENAIQVDLVSQEKAETEELGSEEEIARELIDLLNKDIQFRAEELNLKKESIDNGEAEKSNLEIDDESNQPLSTSMHSILTEQEKKEYEDSFHETDEIVRTEMISELSGDITDISQDKDKNNAIIDNESEKIKLEMIKKAHIEESHVAPLAQFEQDEILEDNSNSEIANENITVKSKLDNINADHINIQEKLEDKQTSMDVPDSQSSDSEIKKPKAENIKQEENEQKELQSQNKHEQEKLEAREEYKQEKLDVEEEIDQEKLKIQSKDDQENIKIEEKIVNMTASPLEIVESRKDSINESMKNDDGNEDIKSNNKSIIDDDQTGKDMENEKEEKSEDLSEKVESVHGPIMSAISEQSTENHSRFGYWTMETKSSTVETVIEASDSNASTEKIVADESEIIADESLIQKKDLAAVVKIQACIRGFLTRRRMRRNTSLEFSSNVPSTQKITSDHLIPQDTSNLREARRLRREEALRNTTLSLENAFATGRLQHTGEFHDSMPLLPFDLLNSKTDSVTSNDSLAEEVDIKEDHISNAKSSANESDTVREHRTTFHKGNTFVDPTFPIVMHLLADASRNCHFTVSQNSHSNFNANARGTKPMEPTVDIVMLGYPRDNENQYLNFITSVEDLNSNMDSLTLHDVKSTKNISDVHPSTTSGEGSLREPLALPGVSQGVVIEEVTSLDEVVPSESTKSSTAPKTSLDTNSSMPSEECALEDAKNDLGISPRTTGTTEDRKQEAEGQESDRNLESVEDSVLHSDDANKNFNEFSGNSREHREEEKDKT